MRKAVLIAMVGLFLVACGGGDKEKQVALVPVLSIKADQPATVGGLKVTFQGSTWKDNLLVTQWRAEAAGAEQVKSLSWGDFRAEGLGRTPLSGGCPQDALPTGYKEPTGDTLKPGESQNLVFCWRSLALTKEVSVQVFARPYYPKEPHARIVVSVVKGP